MNLDTPSAIPTYTPGFLRDMIVNPGERNIQAPKVSKQFFFGI